MNLRSVLGSPIVTPLRSLASRAGSTNGVGLAADLVNAPAQISNFSFARSSVATGSDSAGTLTLRGAQQPRTGGTLVNRLSNPRLEGGTAGVVGSGGVMPTGWGITGTVTRTLSYGTLADGRGFVDIAMSGTATGNIDISLDTAPLLDPGAYTLSCEVALIAGDAITNVASIILRSIPNTGSSASGGSIAASLTSTLQRFSLSATASAGVTTNTALLRISIAGAVGLTIRVCSPQLEAGSSFSSLTLPPVGYPAPSYRDVTPAPGLLIESAATNLAQQSATLDNGYWAKNNSTVTADATAAPSGSLAADLLVEAATATVHELSSGSTVTIAAGGSYAVSVFAKAAGRTQFELRCILGTDGISALFDLGSVSVSSPINTGTASGAAGRIEALPNGWYRCSVSGAVSTTGGTTGYLRLRMASAGATSYTGDGVSGLYLWAAQIEASPVVTSYIPTTTATASRAADLATLSGTAFTNVFGTGGAQQGWVLADVLMDANSSTQRMVVQLDDGAGNRVILRTTTGGATGVGGTVIGGTSTFGTSVGPVSYGTVQRWGLRWGNGIVSACINGSVVQSSAAVTLPNLSVLRIGIDHAAGSALGGRILGIWAGRTGVSDSKFQAAATNGADVKKLLGS